MARFILTTPVLPWPTDQGSKYFQLEVARGLLSLGPVAWVTREIGDQTAAIDRLGAEGFDLRLDHSFRDRSLPARLRRRIGIDARAWRSGVAREESYVCSPAVRDLVARARVEFPEALGVAAYWSATPVLESFPRGGRVYAVSDIDSERERRGPGADARVAVSERNALGRVDLALTLSDEDRSDALALLGGRPAPLFGRCPVSIEIPRFLSSRRRVASSFSMGTGPRPSTGTASAGFSPRSGRACANTRAHRACAWWARGRRSRSTTPG